MENEREDVELTLEEITANTVVGSGGGGGGQDYIEVKTKISGQNKGFLSRMGRRIGEIPKWGKIFLVTSFIFMVAIIVGSIASFISNSFRTNPSYIIYYLDSMAIVTAILMLYFAFEAIWQENEFQLIATLIATISLTIGSVYTLVINSIKYSNRGTNSQAIAALFFSTLIPNIVVFLCQIIMLMLLVPLFRSFGWRLYRVVGVSRMLIKYYRFYVIYITLAKLDTLILLVFLISGSYFIKFSLWYSYLGFSFGMVISLVAAPVSVYLGVKRENIPLQVLFIIFLFGLPIYLIYKIIDIWIKHAVIRIPTKFITTEKEDLEIRIILTIIASLGLLVRALFIICAVIVTMNFGKGLYPIFQKEFLVKNLWNSKSKRQNILGSESNISGEALLENSQE
jgi:MFS family permease